MPYLDQPIVIASGVEIPLLGFGTWQLEAEDARREIMESARRFLKPPRGKKK